jgi:hypothetical protein
MEVEEKCIFSLEPIRNLDNLESFIRGTGLKNKRNL